MNFGLGPKEWSFFQDHLLQPLKSKGARVWIFGSRARGDHRPFSDVDVMVDSDADISSLLSSIREAFQESQFPYKIDLVELKDFASSYRENFEKEKILL